MRDFVRAVAGRIFEKSGDAVPAKPTFGSVGGSDFKDFLFNKLSSTQNQFRSAFFG
jgi:hypothetical protein